MTTTPQQPLSTRQLQELATLLALRTRRELLAGCGAIAHPLRQGAGTDGSELRDFRPDDDARLIRWASVAANAPITVRQLQPEQSIPQVIVLDVSRSMTLHPPKWDLAVTTAALLCALATLDDDSADLLLLSDRPERRLRLEPGLRPLQRTLAAILDAPASAHPRTDLAILPGAVRAVTRRPARIAVISDFLGGDCAPALTQLAGRHDLLLAQVLPPLSDELDALAATELQDAETGRRTALLPQDRNALPQAQADAQERLRQLATSLNATCVPLDGTRPPAQALRLALAANRHRHNPPTAMSQKSLRPL